MLRNLESMLIYPTAVICFVVVGCSSLRTSETDDFADTKSRMVEMRQQDLDLLVSETPAIENDTKPLPTVSGKKGFSLEPQLQPPIRDAASEEVADRFKDSGFSQVIYSPNVPAVVPAVSSSNRKDQSLQPLDAALQMKSLPRINQEEAAERIIILKAKSNSLSNVGEIVKNPGNPAINQASNSKEAPVDLRVAEQLSPITWVATPDAQELIPEVPDQVKSRDVDGQSAVTQVNEKSISTEPLEALEMNPRKKISPIPTVDFKGVEASSLLEPVKQSAVESEGASNGGDEASHHDPESQFDPTTATTGGNVDLSHVASQMGEGETGELIATVSEEFANSPRTASWDVQLKTTIDAFENQIIDLSLTDYRRAKLQQSLAILQVLDDRLSSGRIAIEQPRHRQYWQFQLTAILNMLQAAKTNVTGGRGNVSIAIDHLQSAVVELRKMSDLKIAKLEFCSEVSGYGQYEPMDSSDFRSDSQTLIYCEIENFTPLKETQKARDVYVTRLECRLEILDQEDQVIQSVDFPVVQDIAVNHRRDFYMHLPLTLANLPPDVYSIKLDVKDLGSKKSAKWSAVDILKVE